MVTGLVFFYLKSGTGEVLNSPAQQIPTRLEHHSNTGSKRERNLVSMYAITTTHALKKAVRAMLQIKI